MTKFFELKFGLNSDVVQSQLIDTLKSNGSDVIQTSSGLCIRSSKSLADLQNLFEDANGFSVTELDAQAAKNDPAASPDLKAFLAISQ